MPFLIPSFAVALVLGAGFSIHRTAWSLLLKNKVSYETLWSLGTLGALAQAFLLWNRGSGVIAFYKVIEIMVFILFTQKATEFLLKKFFSPLEKAGEESFPVPKWALRLPDFIISFTIFVGTAAAGIQYYVTDNPDFAFNVLLSVLLVASPWALSLSIPLALHSGKRVCDRRQIPWKNLNFTKTNEPPKEMTLVFVLGWNIRRHLYFSVYWTSLYNLAVWVGASLGYFSVVCATVAMSSSVFLVLFSSLVFRAKLVKIQV